MYVEAKRTFKKDKSEILEAIRVPGNLENYHPFCIENKIEKWPGKGSIDYVKYLNKLKYRREFIKWDESGYVLDIGVKRKVARVKWLVEGNSKASSLKITIEPKLPYKNEIINWLLWHIYIKHRLQSYIDNVVRGFSEYIQTKTRVIKNKYGKHPWYS
tara:strand:- start:166 stop:639 length:474 start_codon:yes stop_codon:yes gene_type:complete